MITVTLYTQILKLTGPIKTLGFTIKYRHLNCFFLVDVYWFAKDIPLTVGFALALALTLDIAKHLIAHFANILEDFDIQRDLLLQKY